MQAMLASWAVPRRVLLVSTACTVVCFVPLVVAYVVAGVPAVLGVGMGYLGCGMAAFTMKPTHALAFAVPAAMTGAVAVALRGSGSLAAACFVALCCLMVAPANMLADSLLAGLPGVAAVLIAIPGTYEAAPVAIAMLVGGVAIIGISLPFGAVKKPRPPVAVPRAWLHGIVMAVAVGASVYATEILAWPHGYWLGLTLTVLLRPYADQTLAKSRQRVIGSVAGVLLSLVLAALLPLWDIVVALLVCQVLNLAYTVLNDYSRQVLFLTPTVVLIGSLAGTGVLAAERAIYTVLAAVIAVAIALVLARIDQRTQAPGTASAAGENAG